MQLPTTKLSAASLALGLLGGTFGCERAPRDAVPSLGVIDTLASPAGPRSAEPNVALSSDGRIWLSWLEQTGDSVSALRVSAYDGSTWSAPATVIARSDLFVNWADFPSVVVTQSGRLVAHWLQRSGSGKYAYDVRVSQSTDGGAKWSEPLILHRDRSQAEHGFVSLFAAAGDSVAAVWLDGRKYAAARDSGEMQLGTTTLAADGSLGDEQMVDERICDCCQTDVALSARGPVVVYRDRSDAEVRDIYLVRREATGWTAPAVVHPDGWTIPGCPVNGPAIAASGDTVVVAWFTAAEDTARVRLAYSFDAGNTFNAPLRIDGGSPIGRVDVQMADSGLAIVSWLERSDSARAELRLRVAGPNGAVSQPLTLATTLAARSSGFPRMALQRRPGAPALVLAWTAHSGDTSRVRVARVHLR